MNKKRHLSERYKVLYDHRMSSQIIKHVYSSLRNSRQKLGDEGYKEDYSRRLKVAMSEINAQEEIG